MEPKPEKVCDWPFLRLRQKQSDRVELYLPKYSPLHIDGDMSKS